VVKNPSFSLDEHCSAFIEGVAAGRYRSVSDVVRSALRLRALREALVVGERSGTSTPFHFDAFLGRMRAEESRGR
jgi:antitoxin ParD1/3/4